jgi:hypothetical protein
VKSSTPSKDQRLSIVSSVRMQPNNRFQATKLGR